MVTANTLETALECVAQGYQALAGGTDVMVLFNAGKLATVPLVSIRKLDELGGFRVSPEVLEIGATVTYTEIREHAIIRSEFPLLAQAAAWTGSIANQNRGTLGGNIANASPAADSSPVLLVYDAELKLISSKGERWLSYSKFHLGYKQMALEPGGLIAAIRLPRNTAGMIQYGRKVGTRQAQAISKLSLAATMKAGVIRIAAGSVAPVPLRCLKTEAFLAGQKLTPAVIEEAKTVIKQDIAPITDIRSTRDYRLAVTENLLGEFLESLL
jgi:CO/xanthine dehydrogenase FAD-binding subunit